MRAWFLAAIAAALVSGASDAVADVLCAKRSGKIVVRESCRRRERPVDAQALGLVGPAGTVGPPGAPGPDASPGGLPYRVIDSTGQPFGVLLAFDTLRARTVVTLPDGPVQFVVINGALNTLEISPYVLYAEPDCAGPPFIRAGGGLVPTVQKFGDVGYYSRAPGFELMTAASVENEPVSDGDTCSPDIATDRGTCCHNIPFGAYVSPAQTVALSTLGVTPPFTVGP